MSQETPAQEAQAPVEAQVQAPQPLELPLIVMFRHQLEGYKQQREQAKIQFEQLNGAIFVCEQMIAQYEEHTKKAAEKFAKDAKEASAVIPLKSNENQGAIDDGKANEQAKKQVAPK